MEMKFEETSIEGNYKKEIRENLKQIHNLKFLKQIYTLIIKYKERAAD